MAVADRTQQILPGGQSPAPFVYTVPGSTSFSLLGVRATFDGTAAAGAFLPCVQIVSDANVLMAQTVGSSVAAGGSADVTFAPFLEADVAGGGGITGPSVEHFVQQDLNISSFATVNFPFTHDSGQSFTAAGTSSQPLLLADGIYAFWVSVQPNTVFNTGRGTLIGVTMQSNPGVFVQAYGSSFPNGRPSTAKFSAMVVGWVAGGGFLQATVLNDDTASRHLIVDATLAKIG